MIYTAYKDGWKQGTPVLLNVPYDAFQYKNSTYASFAIAQEQIPALDNTYTLFYGSSVTQTMLTNIKTWGFTDIDTYAIDANANNNVELYLSPTKYIRITNSGLYYMDGNTQIAVQTIGASSILSMASVNKGYYNESYTNVNTQWRYTNIGSTSTRVRSDNAVNVTPFWDGIQPGGVTPDPYEQGGTSEPGGGGGSFDDSTDTITIPSYTAEELLNRAYGYCGFINVYVTNRNELTQLHNYMFSSLITDTIKKMFADPIECILSLTMLPFTLTSEIASNMIIGTVDSGIASHIAEQQYVTIDCGYIDLTEYWNSYLDFSPYTKTSIYLPYIGTRELDTDKIMGRRISVKYVMDIVSGSCIAYISAETAYDNESLPAETAPLGVIYQFSGNAAIQVPISSATYGEFYASLISGLVTAGATAASIYTGGMSAPVGIAALSGAAINVANSKPQISASGALPAVTGWLGIQKPYITIERPKQCLPEDQNTFTGYPAFVTLTPGDTSGYTEFEVIHLENIPATDAEKDEITNLMKTGVIL